MLISDLNSWTLNTRAGALELPTGAAPTCRDLLCGAMGTVASFILGHHCNIVGLPTLHVLYNAVMRRSCANALLTFAVHHRGAEVQKVTCRLPGNVQDTRQAVQMVLYVLWHTRSWKQSKHNTFCMVTEIINRDTELLIFLCLLRMYFV